MKIPNPLYYPWAVLAGVLIWLGGTKVLRSPEWLVLPLAVVTTITGATLQKWREPETWDLNNPDLEAELRTAKEQAKQLAAKTQILMADANQYLISVEHIDLLVMMQEACNQLRALPEQLDQVAAKFKKMDDLFTMEELQQQLTALQQRLQTRSRLQQQEFQTMATHLEQTLQLVQQGQDTRQAQVVHISTLILNTGTVLQDLQNTLRTADLGAGSTLERLQQLTGDLKIVPTTLEPFILR